MFLCLFLDTSDQRRFPAGTRNVIELVCNRTEPEIRALLPTLPDAIEVVVAEGTRVIPQTGEMGSSVSPTRIVWTVDATRLGNVGDIARMQLRPTLFHECHHLARGWVKSDARRWTRFIDGVVCEGLATAFERDFGGRKPPWGDYPNDVAIWVEELMNLPADAPYHHWMFRHPDGRKWIGYRAGTFIADRAIAATGKTSADLVLVHTNEILASAGFPIHTLRGLG